MVVLGSGKGGASISSILTTDGRVTEKPGRHQSTATLECRDTTEG